MELTITEIKKITLNKLFSYEGVSEAVEKVEEAFAVLYGNNCKPSSKFYLELKPKYFTLFRQNLTELYTNNVEMAKKGFVGKYGNALVSIELTLAGIVIFVND